MMECCLSCGALPCDQTDPPCSFEQLVDRAIEARIDRLGWPEIRAFQERLSQDVYEDAGGFMLRKIKRLFGIKRDPVLTYREAARELLAKDTQGDRG